MALWVFIIPAFLLCLTATAAHLLRTSYWSAVRITFTASALWLLPYLVVLRLVFFNMTPFVWTDLLRFTLVAISGGLLASALSMLIGLVFFADRRVTKLADGTTPPRD